MKGSRLLYPLAAIALAGCATGYVDVKPSAPVALGDGISVDPQIEWGGESLTGLNGTLWTEDGAGLDSLMFLSGIQPGKPLIAMPGKAGSAARVYRADMVPDDVMELLAQNLTRLGYQQVRTTDLRPVPFGSAEGFRFDLAFLAGSGLEIKGMALAAQRGGKLDLILFTAPGEYYFGHYAATVEKIFASVKTTAAKK